MRTLNWLVAASKLHKNKVLDIALLSEITGIHYTVLLPDELYLSHPALTDPAICMVHFVINTCHTDSWVKPFIINGHMI